jgi:hypothetical protein
MASKLIHLKSSVAGLVPGTDELVAGQLAINTADKKLYILGSDSVVYGFFSGGVTSVNTVLPNSSGAVTLTPANLGATTTGTALFTTASAAAARGTLGSTTVGDALFTAASTSAAQTTLGATAVGSAVFTATSTSNAQSAIGATAVGSAVFTAGSTSAAQTAIGATTVGSALFTAANAAAAAATIGAVTTSQVGAANGVAPLDSGSKIPVAYLPSSILGAVIYQGTFVPGTTTLPAAAAANQGWYYIATANGTYTPPSGTLLTFSAGDWIISNGVAGWSVVDSNEDVKSVNGKVGAVVIVAGDITSGTFAAAQTGASAGNNQVLTTNGSGAATWVTSISAAQHAASPVANAVLTTNASTVPAWVTTVPIANLPVGTAASLGIVQAGTGLSVSAGNLSVNTTVLTLDEGTYTGV